MLHCFYRFLSNNFKVADPMFSLHYAVARHQVLAPWANIIMGSCIPQAQQIHIAPFLDALFVGLGQGSFDLIGP